MFSFFCARWQALEAAVLARAQQREACRDGFEAYSEADAARDAAADTVAAAAELAAGISSQYLRKHY